MTGPTYVTETVITAQLSAPVSGIFGSMLAIFSRTGSTLWRLRYAFLLGLVIAAAGAQWRGAVADDKTEVNLELRNRALDRLSSPEAYTENMKRREVRNGMVLEDIPASLDNDDAKALLTARISIPVYSHNPAWGPENAGVTIIEFSDISCIDCTNHYKLLNDLKTRYGNELRWVHKHLPQNPYQATNLTAFYGKIAQRQGNFWEYRHHLLSAKDRTENTLMNALSKAGVDLSTMQHAVRLQARDIYRELDTDVQLGLRQRMTVPPYLFVNGVFISDKVPLTALEDLVRYELQQKKRPAPNPLQAKGARR